MNDANRRPGAFQLDEGRSRTTDAEGPFGRTAGRKPEAFRDFAAVTPAPVDPFESEANDIAATDGSGPRRFSFGAVAAAGLGVLVTLALGMWADSIITGLFERYSWLGWIGLGAAAVCVVGLVGIVAREIIGLRRLASVHALRKRAATAIASNDGPLARSAVGSLVTISLAVPGTARGRAALATLEGEVIDGRDLVRLAEGEILKPLDRTARDMILSSAKRVSVVTAVSPRALIDLGYVVYECARLIRRISTLYGGRPGTLGFIRLAREVIAHLAVTGTVAIGDGVVQQLIGHGLAARVSARLGEGVVNGMMTARVGIAAMDVVRPFPFSAERRPRIGDFLVELGGLAGAEGKPGAKSIGRQS